MYPFPCQFFFLLSYQGLTTLFQIRIVDYIIKIEEIFKKLSSVFIDLNQKSQHKNRSFLLMQKIDFCSFDLNLKIH